ncbi:ubiquinol-cytochrome c reductase cytochrome b subunit [Austwickia chelonae]|uniref:Cytochrome bc1 complex cytochrome b subunit n=1 Tax=Austwickia chelonae NBRC 105200 TaxID=1184607 RepID=K6VLN4_9MICO|nr:ubiquinol-cytochrome c reductase cytochrome b subunit [Austwickia chelonae]GAB77639.1 menaquinol-cytochrome c reductase cytochrome b subunit [Austwickia chelonae NBRC 105200]SEW14703.1 ubiquinol-cytochrome c reductase cytochrome b subunit [Austwickia chelonae]
MTIHSSPSSQERARAAADSLRAEDVPPPRATDRRGSQDGGAANWFDERTGAAKPLRYLMNKVFPDHWSFMLGEIAMYSMLIALITGVFLTFWFVPSAGHVVYDGSYVPLKGLPMSEAYASTLNISFDVRGGLLIRQLHHWSALFFVAAVGLHACRVFFTGAFRKPREINWVIGTVLLLLACIEGFAGYSLPDDLLSGTGIRVMEGFVESSPIIGSYLSYMIFGGAFPGEHIIPRLYIAHVLLVPALIIGLFTAHLILVMVHKHTQYPGPGKTNDNVVGFPVMPVYAAKAGGFFFIVFGIIALISGLVAINPVWMYGPYDPSPVTADSQPDWYMGFADGALRLLPGQLEFEILGYTLSLNLAIGSIMLLPVVFTLMGAYPFFEAWVTGDHREHHLLDRPRNAPVRTAIGAAALTAYLVMFLAAGNDLMAIKMGLSINDITRALQVLFFVGPVLVFWVTKRLCLSLQLADRAKVLHGHETGRIVFSERDGFSEAHEPLDPYQRWNLVQHESPQPLLTGRHTDAMGNADPKAKHGRARSFFSRFYFSDRVEPVTPAELSEAQSHHHDYAAVLLPDPAGRGPQAVGHGDPQGQPSQESASADQPVGKGPSAG